MLFPVWRGRRLDPLSHLVRRPAAAEPIGDGRLRVQPREVVEVPLVQPLGEQAWRLERWGQRADQAASTDHTGVSSTVANPSLLYTCAPASDAMRPNS